MHEPTDLDRADVLRLVAHDIKNPLTAVRVLAEMLLEDAPPGLVGDLSDLVEAVDLAVATADALADLGRVEADEEPTWIPDTVDLARATAEIVGRPAFAGVTEPVVGAGRARADEGAVGRVLVGVLLNGRRMLGPDARMAVRVAGHTIEVELPGVLLPPSEREALLSLYGGPRLKARKVRSSALGLGYARHVLDAIGGAVELLDGERGLTVRVRFLPEPDDAPTPGAAARSRPGGIG